MEVVNHFKEFGPITTGIFGRKSCAASQAKKGGGRVDELVIRRSNKVTQVTGKMNMWELFSICGKLLWHYTVAGWLREKIQSNRLGAVKEVVE